ncbi:tyrosine-type recombinase/integrase [Oribacterium sp. WCC10]|uniref:tyrosine-type recombinase/integrase n=1 Tax=Oribacterium sp. WCC10 TaxID=1855343 RepID=UPI0008E8A28E|nr:tyrosine-type recombinase/integrase [Oribacterium sp. WCC10]SFG08622.1 Site-specific recombinase XerD [Oribacterium sp. WCC10]
MALKYHEQVDRDNTIKLRELLSELPKFCTTFFRGIEQRTSSRTRIAYAYDLKVFFQFLIDQNPLYKGRKTSDFNLDDIDNLSVLDIEDYMEYLKYRKQSRKDSKGNVIVSDVINSRTAIKRKVASLRTFYNYFYKNQLIKNNPAALIQMPRLKDKEIIRMDVNEVADFLDEVENGDGLTKRQQIFHDKTELRDSAMMTLMLGTGIRVSECVGLNIGDIDFNNDGIHIHRKGGKEVTVYFGDEVEGVLRRYMDYRKHIIAETGSEDALFLSLRNQRITVRSVQYMVKKYAKTVTPLKHITPHKLRSTYGTNLYKETGDIYLVADVLGHNDVNTTKKHYAALEDERRRSARNKVHLRND